MGEQGKTSSSSGGKGQLPSRRAHPRSRGTQEVCVSVSTGVKAPAPLVVSAAISWPALRAAKGQQRQGPAHPAWWKLAFIKTVKLIQRRSFFLEAEHTAASLLDRVPTAEVLYAPSAFSSSSPRTAHAGTQNAQFMTVFFSFCCAALRIGILRILHPFHGHVFLRGVILNLIPFLAVHQRQVPHLRDARYLKRATSCLQPAEQRRLHHPDQHRRRQRQHVQEHPGGWCGQQSAAIAGDV